MKKLMIAAAIVCAATFANAAVVGWSCAGLSSYASDKYMFFVVGEKGVTDMAQITAFLDAGTDVSSYAFGDGTVAANGNAMQSYSGSGKTLTPSETTTYHAFFVLFDSADPQSGNAKYITISETQNANMAKQVGTSTANVTFNGQNQGTYVNNPDNWASFGPEPGPEPVPEPTSAMLLLLGVAGLALRRKQA